MTNTGWKKSKTAKTCNVFPTVWAAIYGCKGEKTNTWRYGVFNMGRQSVEYACPTCQAAKDAIETMNHAERVEHLHAVQKAAGVEDYRTAIAKVINGVPTILPGSWYRHGD